MIARSLALIAAAPRALLFAALVLGVTHEGRAGDARIDYMLHCQGCHLPDGSGSPGAVPSLRNSIGRFLELPAGREFLVRVPGAALSALDDAALASVLNWMVREFGPAQTGRKREPLDAAEVAVYRAEPLIEVESARRALLLQLDGEPAVRP